MNVWHTLWTLWQTRHLPAPERAERLDPSIRPIRDEQHAQGNRLQRLHARRWLMERRARREP